MTNTTFTVPTTESLLIQVRWTQSPAECCARECPEMDSNLHLESRCCDISLGFKNQTVSIKIKEVY